MEFGQRMKRCFYSAVAAGALFIANAGHADDIFVDLSVSSSGDGSSWVLAFDTLQEGISKAILLGGVGHRILCAEGEYKPGISTDPRTVTYSIPNGVAVYGGYPQGGGTDAERDPYTYITTLNGDLSTNGSNRVYHVVTFINTSDVNTRLDGFTIKNGLANGSDSNGEGGGLMIRSELPGALSQTDPLIVRCRFLDNDATLGGAASIRIVHQGSLALPRFINCEFVGNSATSDGGSVCLRRLPNIHQRTVRVQLFEYPGRRFVPGKHR